MNPLTREWVEKAEADMATAARELRVRKSPNYDAVCFHAQQCAEKYMKAVLHAAAIPFARTHNLAALLHLALDLEPSWEMMRPDLQGLTAMAVGFRYPGRAADKAAARHAVAAARNVRARARLHLGLKTAS
ncbi:MAG: HEPN domain-containing protein [Planctomycetes bacterium]|nr:HEPN domain-containing protein [Planctomycetota bacterium]